MDSVAVITISQSEWNDTKALIQNIAEKVTVLTSKEQKELLTPHEVMKILKIGRTTFDRYVRESILPITKVNTKKYAKIYIKRSDFERLIQEELI